ncbi:MAG: flavodoxin [Oscillospiraceae bacterium]|nr:flavodoxin [Oscillospiraceae bacterium]
MKKLASLILSAVLALSFSACRNSGTGVANDTSANQTQSESTSAENNTQSEISTSESSDTNVLIAYFTAAENSGVDAVSSASYSMVNGEAVGRLRAIANMIQTKTGGELFSIQTSVVYPTDGGELIEYAADEQANDARPELTSHIDDFEKYDVVFVGYPNWWADLPQVMYSFFDEYDFSGKTIIPFNVHNGSRLSRTVETIAELEPDAAVETNAFTISEHNVPDAEKEVSDWLEELGY